MTECYWLSCFCFLFVFHIYRQPIDVLESFSVFYTQTRSSTGCHGYASCKHISKTFSAAD